jgi:tripeptidyl-peptidase-1
MYALCQDLQNTTDAAARPAVISMSYAWSESNQCSGTTGAQCSQLGVDAQQYVNRTNQEFAKVGLMGITMLSASGDSGCHGRTEGICLFQKNMKPAYPASSPYVTSVGGTMLHHGQVGGTEPVCQAGGDLAGKCAAGGQEVVSSTGAAGGAISSGGGFAQYSPMPAYQQDAVAKYLANDTAMQFAGGKGTLFNAGGRGYPDISALAHKFYIVMHNSTGSVDGTSAASPTIAGLVGLINTRRIAAGKPVVGFFNPALYQIHSATGGEAFNDITEGNNACTEEGCWCKTGFAAAPGWDASTGLGTPNVGIIIEQMAAFDRAREQR